MSTDISDDFFCTKLWQTFALGNLLFPGVPTTCLCVQLPSYSWQQQPLGLAENPWREGVPCFEPLSRGGAGLCRLPSFIALKSPPSCWWCVCRARGTSHPWISPCHTSGKVRWQGTRTGKGLLAVASGGVRGSWILALLPVPQSSCLRLSFCGQLLKYWYVSCFLDFQINSRSHVGIQSQF